MSATSYYLLGRAVAAFDPDSQTLTPACVNNLLGCPASAKMILRHVWDAMVAHERTGGLLGKIDWINFRPNTADSSSYWLGFYHERAGVHTDAA